MFILIECKWRSNAKIKPEEINGFAQRIQVIDAKKGFFVTTIGYLEGTKRVANANKIEQIILNQGATKEKYLGIIKEHIFSKLTVRKNLSITPRIEK